MASDSFLFGSGAIFNSSDFGVDSVSDFIKGSDKIILSKTSFNALVSAVGNSLQTAEFASINDANELNLVGSSSAKIVYNLATGNLFYNQNGATAGLGNGALFATFNGIPQLSENDIFPSLSKQPAKYSISQLTIYQENYSCLNSQL